MAEKFVKWFVDGHEFSIKYIFDHLRNIGLCALLLGASIYLIRGEINFELPLYFIYRASGWLVLLVGIVLVLVNSIQFSMVAAFGAAKIDLNKWITLLIVFLITIWGQCLMYFIIYVHLKVYFS